MLHGKIEIHSLMHHACRTRLLIGRNCVIAVYLTKCFRFILLIPNHRRFLGEYSYAFSPHNRLVDHAARHRPDVSIDHGQHQ